MSGCWLSCIPLSSECSNPIVIGSAFIHSVFSVICRARPLQTKMICPPESLTHQVLDFGVYYILLLPWERKLTTCEKNWGARGKETEREVEPIEKQMSQRQSWRAKVPRNNGPVTPETLAVNPGFTWGAGVRLLPASHTAPEPHTKPQAMCFS